MHYWRSYLVVSKAQGKLLEYTTYCSEHMNNENYQLGLKFDKASLKALIPGGWHLKARDVASIPVICSALRLQSKARLVWKTEILHLM